MNWNWILLISAFILCTICDQNVSSDVYSACMNYPKEKYTQIDNKCYHVPDPHNNPKLKDTCRPEVLSMFFSWTSYAYIMVGKNFSEEEHKRLLGCGSWKIVNEFHVLNKLFVSAHLQVIVSEEQGVVIFSSRGTNLDFFKYNTHNDWLGNFIFRLTQCPFGDCGRIHLGFTRTYLATREYFMNQVKLYIKAGYRIILTGHSQGGAVATIASVDLLQLYPEYADKVEVYSFGCPRVGDAKFVEKFNNLVIHTKRIIAKYGLITKDVVVRVPLQFMNYEHVKNEVIVKCNPKYFGNPSKIGGIKIVAPAPKNIPKMFGMYIYGNNKLGCHYQQVYIDGLLYEGPASHIENEDVLDERINDISPILKNTTRMEIQF